MSAELGLHMGPEGVYLRMPRMLASIISRLDSVIFERWWWLGNIPGDWKKTNTCHQEWQEGRFRQYSAGWSALTQSLGRLDSTSSWKLFPSMWRTKKWLGGASRDLPDQPDYFLQKKQQPGLPTGRHLVLYWLIVALALSRILIRSPQSTYRQIGLQVDCDLDWISGVWREWRSGLVVGLKGSYQQYEVQQATSS